MKNVDSWFIAVAILYALLGTVFGIWMGMNEAFDYADFHAHVNLIGWASFAIFGLVYRAYPKMAECRLAAHFWVANLGAIVFIPGVYIVITTKNMVLVAIGSLIVTIR
ncbi:MAG: cytochrome-c oxidase [Alphaproteobacteria bacterium]